MSEVVPILQCFCGCSWVPSAVTSAFVCPGCGRIEPLLLSVMP